MTLTSSLTLCQYCEHANAADAKFCTGCGAPLHLIPCPQCGAVNQKTSKTCYQCHGQLRESTEILLASAPATPSEEAAGNAESTAMSATYKAEPQTPQRQPAYVIAIIIAAFTAAGYFAYQQRSVVGAKEAASSNPSEKATAKAALPLPANSIAGAINKSPPAPVVTPAAPEKNIVAPQGSAGTATEQGKVERVSDLAPEPAAVRQSVGRRRARTEMLSSPDSPSTSSAAAVLPSSAIEKPSTWKGPCTEAIAALGLCTSAPTKGNP